MATYCVRLLGIDFCSLEQMRGDQMPKYNVEKCHAELANSALHYANTAFHNQSTFSRNFHFLQEVHIVH